VNLKDAATGAFGYGPRPPESEAAKVARQNREISALLAIPHTPGASYGKNPPNHLNPSKKRTASGMIKETSKSSTVVTTGAAAIPAVSSLIRSATMTSSVANIGPFLHRAETFPITTSTSSPARAIGDAGSNQQGPVFSPMSAAMSRQHQVARLPQPPPRVQPIATAPVRRPSTANLDFSKTPKADPFRTRKSLGKASAGRDQFPQTAPVIRRMGGATSQGAQAEDSCPPDKSSDAASVPHPLPARPSTTEAQGVGLDIIPTMPQSMRPVGLSTDAAQRPGMGNTPTMPKSMRSMLPTLAIDMPIATPWVPLSARPSSAVSSAPSVAPVAPMTPADFMPLDVKFTIPADHAIDKTRDPRRAAGIDRARDPRRRKISETTDIIVIDSD